MKNKQDFTICAFAYLDHFRQHYSIGHQSKATSGRPRNPKMDLYRHAGAFLDKNDIVSPCEVNHIAIGSDGKTFYAVDIANPNNTDGSKALYKSTDSGISWSDTYQPDLYQAMTPAEQGNFRIWNIAVAPDDVNFVAVVTNDSTTIYHETYGYQPTEATNGRIQIARQSSNISTIDISPSYGSRDIAIGTRTGAAGGTIWILKAPDYNNWVIRALPAIYCL